MASCLSRTATETTRELFHQNAQVQEYCRQVQYFGECARRTRAESQQVLGHARIWYERQAHLLSEYACDKTQREVAVFRVEEEAHARDYLKEMVESVNQHHLEHNQQLLESLRREASHYVSRTEQRRQAEREEFRERYDHDMAVAIGRLESTEQMLQLEAQQCREASRHATHESREVWASREETTIARRNHLSALQEVKEAKKGVKGGNDTAEGLKKRKLANPAAMRKHDTQC